MTLPAGARDVTRVGGGNINEAFSVTLDGVRAFVKTRAGVAPGEYAAEALGLQWLAEPGALRTPRVLGVDQRYLALEWVAGGRLDDAGAVARRPVVGQRDGRRARAPVVELFGGSYGSAAERAAQRFA